MRVDRALEHEDTLVQRQLPERLAPLGQRVAAPYVVDQDVEAILLASHALEKRGNLFGLGMIHPRVYSDSASRRDHLRGLLDRFRPVRCGWLAADAASGAVDRRSRVT